MSLKRVVTIQDISCFGKCSLTVALPLISSLGVETAVIPTAVLSTHTGGFKDFTYRDLTEDIPKIAEHWNSLGLKFDMIYTGYLGSFQQLKIVSDFFDTFKREKTSVFVDPAMGDNGKLYTGFSEEFAKEMAKLCAKADYIAPNVTEAAFMLGDEYKKICPSEEYAKDIVKRLGDMGAENVILTGVSYKGDDLGIMTYNRKKNEYHSYIRDLIGGSFHGTGDVFSSVCAACLTRGLSLEESADTAVDFVVDCIKTTIPDIDEHWYSVEFEKCIPSLIERVNGKTGE